jgi:hypothetical protein
MRTHLAALLLTATAFVAACGNSKSFDGRDSAVPANDSSLGKDAQADVAVPDGPSPDGPAVADTGVRETAAADLGRDSALPDGPVDGYTTAKDTTAVNLDPDTALPDAPVGLDADRQETARDVASMDTAGARGDALEIGRDGPGTSPDGALAAFCTGGATRSMVNGFSGAPVVRVSRIATGCCDGFELELNSATFASPIYASAVASGDSFVPVDIDLGNPPQGWSFRISSDCATTLSSCKEQFDSGFVGTFRTAWVEDSTAIDLSLCLHVEDVDGSHELLRTFDLYIPHVIAN